MGMEQRRTTEHATRRQSDKMAGRTAREAARRAFDYSLDFKNINFREHPELYRIGKGEQGVLSVEPYKSEILPYWRFRTPDVAQQSADKIFQLFCRYKESGDFIGMDMARKFLMMGWTRARRYANHSNGIKYSKTDRPDAADRLHKRNAAQQPVTEFKAEHNRRHVVRKLTKEPLPVASDNQTNEKAVSASIFREKYLQAHSDAEYQQMCRKHRQKFET
eukprot:GILJ01005737.1.p1 GENE.GILJ01005737.1~~GILJ01005737.1.p1  ORF type:complete len:219 (+),score=17.52 GILJ01005737.1:3-659(+)